jgi:DNA-binding NarL/FixJ family response regulator
MVPARYSPMSPTSLAHPLPARTRTVATITGGDGGARRRSARLLGGAGFAITTDPEPGSLVVLLGRAADGAVPRDVRALAEAHPDARILAVVPARAPNAAMRRALLAGATGIVLEDQVDRALVATARAMLAGQLAVPPSLGRKIAPQPLSHREKQVLALVVDGLSNREIADRLYLSESTIKTHLSSAFRKLDARSRAEVVARIQDPDAGYGMAILALPEGSAA